MIVFGNNLMVLGREVDAAVRQVGMYTYGAADCVSMYETDDLGAFLNLPDKAYANFSAWFQIPGDNAAWRRPAAPVQFLDAVWKMPGAASRKAPNGCKDLFSYLSRCYCKVVKEAVGMRLFDLVYVAAAENGLGVGEFVERTALKW